jgi:hypothetical protein
MNNHDGQSIEIAFINASGTGIQCRGFDSGQSDVGFGGAPATRVRAADSILNHTSKAIEIEDIERRVSELERAAEESKRDADEGASLGLQRRITEN